MKTRALPSAWYSPRLFLHLPHIPENPPCEEKEYVSVESVAMVGEATEGVVARKNAVGKEDEQEERNGENEEIVIRQRFYKMTVQHGMNGTLESTGRTLCPCQQSPHAFGNEERSRGWVHDIIKDSCHQDGNRNQNS